ncbi:ATP-binding protein [Kitasatospora sp. NBC_00458]|uniref:ATP-binding protein n=1 Tax=Kitasatospora sp. NBC_00458 TaxID=2903568 RepID=UPI002E17DBA4
MTTDTRPQPRPLAPIGAKRAAWAVDQAPDAVSVLRANASKVLQTWGIDPDGDQVFAALLVLTELVTNASQHGRPALGLIDTEMWLADGHVIVAVTDGTTEAPVKRTAGSGDESGRGLALISVYAESVGYEPLPAGKRVWAVIGPHAAPEGRTLLAVPLDPLPYAV